MERIPSSKLWWLKAHNSSPKRRSTWLQSTIQELDEKTMSMLKIIEQDGSSFAQRAEMYYKKRPELISMVEELYRSYQSLAEKFYAAKLESRIGGQTPQGSPVPCFKSKLEKSISVASLADQGYDIYTESMDSDEYCTESEVDDPEQEEVTDSEFQEVSSPVMVQEMVKLNKEIEKLRIENRIQEKELAQKDEEKREVIRQLSLAMDMIREENLKLRKTLAATTKESTPNKKWNIPEFHKLRVFFSKS